MNVIIGLITLESQEEPLLKTPKPLEASEVNCRSPKSFYSSSFAMAGSSSDLLTTHHDLSAPPPLNPLDYSISWKSTEAKNLVHLFNSETILNAISEMSGVSPFTTS